MQPAAGPMAWREKVSSSTCRSAASVTNSSSSGTAGSSLCLVRPSGMRILSRPNARSSLLPTRATPQEYPTMPSSSPRSMASMSSRSRRDCESGLERRCSLSACRNATHMQRCCKRQQDPRGVPVLQSFRTWASARPRQHHDLPHIDRSCGRPYDCRPGGLRTGSPPSPPPRLIRPTVRLLPRSPRLSGPGPHQRPYGRGIKPAACALGRSCFHLSKLLEFR